MPAKEDTSAHNVSLEFSYWTAGANWLAWRADFEFEGDKASMPVLKCEDRYQLFTREYSLLRYKKHRERNKLRCRLLGSEEFRNALVADDGSGIDEFASRLCAEFPDFGMQRSFISKLAAFAKPASFSAWDRFARCGIAKLTSDPLNGNYKAHRDYLRVVNIAMAGHLGTDIQCYLKDKSLPTEKRLAFVRRVLDMYLMRNGGRWARAFA